MIVASSHACPWLVKVTLTLPPPPPPPPCHSTSPPTPLQHTQIWVFTKLLSNSLSLSLSLSLLLSTNSVSTLLLFLLLLSTSPLTLPFSPINLSHSTSYLKSRLKPLTPSLFSSTPFPLPPLIHSTNQVSPFHFHRSL